MKHLFKKGYTPWNKGKTGLIKHNHNGERNPFYGKTHSKETRERMKLARIGKMPSNLEQLIHPSKEQELKRISSLRKFRPTLETRKKLSEAHKGEKSHLWKGGKPNCPHCGKILSTRQAKLCRTGWLDNKEPTSIEKSVYDLLLLKGILFEKQKRIGDKFTVDAYIPSLNLIIEADGSYWHSLPKAIVRDKYKDIVLKDMGFDLLRLSEEEIRSGKFKERLVDKIG